jgi:hypothetical protein
MIWIVITIIATLERFLTLGIMEENEKIISYD